MNNIRFVTPSYFLPVRYPISGTFIQDTTFLCATMRFTKKRANVIISAARSPATLYLLNFISHFLSRFSGYFARLAILFNKFYLIEFPCFFMVLHLHLQFSTLQSSSYHFSLGQQQPFCDGVAKKVFQQKVLFTKVMFFGVWKKGSKENELMVYCTQWDSRK